MNVHIVAHYSVVLLYSVAALLCMAAKIMADPNVSEQSVLQTQDLLMRGAKPLQPDAYLCTAYPMTYQEAYIYKFEALANASTAHHILLYGCPGEPYSNKPIWNCPKMCTSDQETILFAWAKNAPATVLPKGVGLRTGQLSSVKTIVLQVHYAKNFAANDSPDHSGVRIYTTEEKQLFVAGIFLLASKSFLIPPGNPSYPVDVSCRFTKTKSIFPFAYRTHSHNLGTVITGYQYNNTYHEIGKGNPQWPQAFYPVKEKIEVKPDDYLAARCTYDSTRKNVFVPLGRTADLEMCNFYIMFYTDSSVIDPYGECSDNAVPQLTGSSFPPDVSIPLPPDPSMEDEAKEHHHYHVVQEAHHRHKGLSATESPSKSKSGTDSPTEDTNRIESSNEDKNEMENPTANTKIHLEHSLVFNESWPADKVDLGQIGGVATDSDGNVYIFHRGSRTWTAESFSYDNDFLDQESPIPEEVIVVLDSQGRLLRKFGAGQYFMPHGIEIDQNGNIWLTDVALHQVFKIPQGEIKPSLILGQRFKHGQDITQFCKPTDVAVLSSGEFFVSDGYCNGRVLKFSKDGKVIKAWGERNVVAGNPPAAGTFDIPHSITAWEEGNLVCVADRENGRVQCFDLNGKFRYIIKHAQFGPKLFAIDHSPLHGGILYVVNGPVSGPRDFTVQGFTLDIRTGDLLEMWNVPQTLKNPHDLCVHPGSHSVYVGELNPHAVWKLSRSSAGLKSGNTTPKTQKQDIVKLETKTNVNTTVQPGKPVIKLPTEVGSSDTTVTMNKTKGREDADLAPSLIIGCLLVIPVILLLVITLLVRAHKSGKLKCYGHKQKRVFSLQGILGNSHKGFDPLSTEDSDHDLDHEDSDHEEYLAPKKIKSKA